MLRPFKYESIFDPNISHLNDDYVESYYSGFYDENGIFLVYGNGIRSKSSRKFITIFDIAPTILHMLGTPIPSDVDGRILLELYDDPSIFRSRKPKFLSPKEIFKMKLELGGKAPRYFS
jgi:hypothetical protein